MLETICDILVDAYKRNWITSRDGNVSIRHHDRDHFYVTPSGVRKQTLQPDQFKKIKLLDDMWEEMEYTTISSNLKPSGEIPLHYGLQCHESLKLDKNGFTGYDIVGIKGHGVVAIDASPWQAYEHIERLEHICKIVLASGKREI